MDVVAGEGATVLADVLGRDYRTWRRKITIDPACWPGEPIAPFLVVREGPGRTAYFAGQVGAEHRRFKCTTVGLLIERAVAWAAGAAPAVRLADEMKAVRMVVDALPDESGYLVMLINHATNDVVRGGYAWCNPIADVRVAIDWPTGAKAELVPLTSTAMSLTASAGAVEIAVSKLEIYAAFEVRKK